MDAKPEVKFHFLVVNDDDTLRRVIVALLKEIGHLKVSVAEDGEMALRSMKLAKSVGAPVDFLITDCSMPLMNGLELTRSLRDDGETMPILMITKEATADNIRAAVEAGADSYYVQPFKAASFRKKIDGLLVEKGLKDRVLTMGVL